VNLDNLTYAGNLQNLASVERHPAYHFEKGDICDPTFSIGCSIAINHAPSCIFAAESTWTALCSGPEAFVRHQHRRHLPAA